MENLPFFLRLFLKCTSLTLAWKSVPNSTTSTYIRSECLLGSEKSEGKNSELYRSIPWGAGRLKSRKWRFLRKIEFWAHSLTSFRVDRSCFSSCLSLSWYSPWSFNISERFASTSGRSDLKTALRHWDWSEDWVTVKLTRVTRLHSGGENSCDVSRVAKKILKVGDKSISWSLKNKMD